MAAHLGVLDEDVINNMSYVFFEDVLEQLGHRLTYQAVVNYAGNSFCEKSWDMIEQNNPFNVVLNKEGKTNRKTSDAIANFFASADIKIIKKDKGDNNENNK